jgi:hypothetical protein
MAGWREAKVFQCIELHIFEMECVQIVFQYHKDFFIDGSMVIPTQLIASHIMVYSWLPA